MEFVYCLPPSDWKYSDEDFKGSHDFSLNVFYVKLLKDGFRHLIELRETILR